MIKEIYGKKLGMTQIFDREGNLIASTLVEVEPVCFLEKVEYPGKNRVRIGCFKLEGKKTSKIKKPIEGYFRKLGVGFYKLIREVAIEKNQDKTTGEQENNKNDSKEIGVEMFKDGDVIDVQAKTKGRGFAGGMKRHGWAGQPASHGHTSHRRIGSAGASAYPSRIIKGLHMPGHMGNSYRTIKNLKVLKVDKENNLLFVQGGIPGTKGTIVKLRKVDCAIFKV